MSVIPVEFAAAAGASEALMMAIMCMCHVYVHVLAFALLDRTNQQNIEMGDTYALISSRLRRFGVKEKFVRENLLPMLRRTTAKRSAKQHR